MKVPLSRSDGGGGGGLFAWVLGTSVLAGVLALGAGTAMAAAAQPPLGPPGPVAPAATAPAKPTLKVVVIGDSFTSGEGASSSTYRTALAPTTTEDGITYYTPQIDPAHQSSTAPSLQALNQIQAANPNVDIQVSFVPVSGATRDSLYQPAHPGTPFEQPPQINAVKGADVVIVGIGGNDARFSDWITTVLGSTEASSTQQFQQFMQPFNNGSYLDGQVKLLNDVSSLAAPNATIISLGYPKALPATVPGTPTWWSPFSWSTISQGEADMSNQLATTLNINNQDASFQAAAAHPQQQWLYADLSNALQGHELFTSQEGLNGLTPGNLQGSYHPNDLGQRLLASVLQPYVEQAVNDQLNSQGVQGAQNVPPVTPTFSNQWNLRVDIPLQQQQQGQQANQPPADTPQKPADTPQAPADTKPQAPADNKAPAEDKPQQPAQDAPAPAPSDQPAKDQSSGPAQPDTTKQDTTQQDTNQPASQPGTPQPSTTQSSTAQPNTAAPNQPATTDQPGTAQPNDTQPAAPADQPATPADQPAAPAGNQPAAADTPGTPAAGANQPAPAGDGAASPDSPAAPAPATGDTPAQAGRGASPDSPPAPAPAGADPSGSPAAAPQAGPVPADSPAAPAPADSPAAPAPAESPAVPAPAAPPAAPAPAEPPAAPAPAAPPAAPAPVDIPAPPPAAAPPPAPVVVPDPVPIIDPGPVIAPPPPVIAPLPPPVITPPVITPIDSGSGGDTGLGSSLDPGLGSSTDTGLGAIDTGGVGGDGGGGGGD